MLRLNSREDQVFIRPENNLDDDGKENFEDDEANVRSEGIHTSKSKSVVFRNGLSVIINNGFLAKGYL